MRKAFEKPCKQCISTFKPTNSGHQFCSTDCYFAFHIHKDKSGCWLWTGVRNAAGYGIMRPQRKNPILVHRFSYERFYGPLKPGLYACHKCDNPPCVNPDHLFAGTRKDNTQDSIKKGRHKPPPILIGVDNVLVRHPELRPMGENHHSAHLTEEQVIEIYNASGLLSEIGKRFGVGKSHVSAIKNRKIWKHILDPENVGKNTR